VESWVPFFVGVVAAGVVVQTVLLALVFVHFRRTNRRLTRIAEDLHSRLNPVISKVQMMVDDAQPRVSQMLSDATEITILARAQVQRADRIMAEATDRLRLQLVHADQILTGALETVEEAGSKLRRSILVPLQSIAALIRGVQVGLEFYRGVRRRSPEVAPEHQDESLFI
jgi:hypothetical protein